MTQPKLLRLASVAALSLTVLVSLSTVLFAQSKAEGSIKSRNGETMLLQTADNPNLTVVLTDGTSVGQVQGAFTGGVTYAQIRSPSGSHRLLNFRTREMVLHRREVTVRDGTVGQHQAIQRDDGYAGEGPCTEIPNGCL